jgi:molybdate transport system permease protein
VTALVPVFLSLRVASLATVLTLLAGLGLARLLARPRTPLRRLWETFILLPMVFPPTITGYLLLLMLGRHGPIGRLLAPLGLSVVFTWVGAVIASFVVSLPLMYQSCKSAFAGVDHRVENAARSLGLSEARVFRRVTLPLAARGILAGTALSFARALGEFGATLMVAGNIPGRTATIPLAIYDAVEGGRGAEANLLLGITVGLSFALVAVVGLTERRVRRKGGASAHEGAARGGAGR